MQTVNVILAIDLETCANCGITFGLSHDYRERLRKNGETFYCPKGHKLWFGESAEDKLKRQLASSQETSNWWKEQAESASGSLRATRGVVTKLRRAAARGQCPNCHQAFDDLSDHMQQTHPEFVKEHAEMENGE